MLGATIRRLRHWRGLSLQDLAAASGLTKAGLSHIETDHRGTRPDTLAAIAAALGVTVERLEAEALGLPVALTDAELCAALAACVLAYDPAALVSVGPLDSDLGPSDTLVVAAWLSNGDIELIRDKDGWQHYLTRHAAPARLQAALDDLAAIPDPPPPPTPSAKRVYPSVR